MSLELKAELFMAIEDYESKGLKQRDNGLDITAVDNKSDDKVLLRLITKPERRSGYVGMDTVDKMVTTIATKDYDKGILVAEKFTESARKKLAEEGIQRVSENAILAFPPKRLYSAVMDLVDDHCRTRCGKVPQEESDCKGHLNNHYSCKARLISDNASFHFERGWTSLLKADTLGLLSLIQSSRK